MSTPFFHSPFAHRPSPIAPRSSPRAPFLLIHDYGGYAFPIELSLELANRGYRVLHVYTSASGSPTAAFPHNIANYEAIDVDVPQVRKGRFFQRWLGECNYGARVARLIRRCRPDLVLSANTPLDAQRQIAAACAQVNSRFIFWLHDLLSIATATVLSHKIGFAGKLIGRYYHRMEKILLSRADAIIAITEAFTTILAEWGVDPAKVSVIPNWAPIDSIPVGDKINLFSQEFNLADKFVVLYSGTMGMKQNPGIVVQAAQALLAHKNIFFVVISNGVGMDFLTEQKKKLNLENLLLLPLQPFERLPDILASADAGLALLARDAGAFCVPSKVWSIYCSARPALLVVPEDNLAAQITKKQKAGIVLSPDESDRLAEAILELAASPEQARWLGANGRKYAEENFRIGPIADAFEKIIHTALAK